MGYGIKAGIRDTHRDSTNQEYAFNYSLFIRSCTFYLTYLPLAFVKILNVRDQQLPPRNILRISASQDSSSSML